LINCSSICSNSSSSDGLAYLIGKCCFGKLPSSIALPEFAGPPLLKTGDSDRRSFSSPASTFNDYLVIPFASLNEFLTVVSCLGFEASLITSAREESSLSSIITPSIRLQLAMLLSYFTTALLKVNPS
jgi:hypothetical protein